MEAEDHGITRPSQLSDLPAGRVILYRGSTEPAKEQDMTTATASVDTDRPVPYMRQLCKHFGH